MSIPVRRSVSLGLFARAHVVVPERGSGRVKCNEASEMCGIRQIVYRLLSPFFDVPRSNSKRDRTRRTITFNRAI